MNPPPLPDTPSRIAAAPGVDASNPDSPAIDTVASNAVLSETILSEAVPSDAVAGDSLPDWSHRRGALIVFSGPSGVGKDTVLRDVRRRDPQIRQCVTATSRPPRPDEIEGRDYLFISEEEFRERIQRGYFLEFAIVHGDFKGTPRASVQALLAAGYDVILKIDVQGGAQVTAAIPEVVTIFLAPPSMEELDRRLFDRATEDPAQLETRRKDALQELARMSTYQYVVVNRDADQAVEDVLCILRAERFRSSRLTYASSGVEPSACSPSGESVSGEAERSQ
jgi:guanylate kinase